MKQIGKDEYFNNFFIKEYIGIRELDNIKLRRALQTAHDIRKFEIDLYWKRATYFWTLIAAAFAGYFLIFNAEHLSPQQQNFFAFIISCVGIIFSWAWFRVNRGSKFWQENWENHIDMLEDEITGPLYKTVIFRPKETEWKEKLKKSVTGPAPVSASKINNLVSFFMVFIWVLLVCYSVRNCIESIFSLLQSSTVLHAIYGVIAITTVLFLIFICRAKTDAIEQDDSDKPDYENIAKIRKNIIRNKK